MKYHRLLFFLELRVRVGVMFVISVSMACSVFNCYRPYENSDKTKAFFNQISEMLGIFLSLVYQFKSQIEPELFFIKIVELLMLFLSDVYLSTTPAG